MPTPDVDLEHDERLDQELAGMDALELADAGRRPLARRMWSVTWPKLAAIAIALGLWEAVVASGWRPEFVLPPPEKVWDALVEQASEGTLWAAMRVTLRRA